VFHPPGPETINFEPRAVNNETSQPNADVQAAPANAKTTATTLVTVIAVDVFNLRETAAKPIPSKIIFQM
jgi:hypothetical protein